MIRRMFTRLLIILTLFFLKSFCYAQLDTAFWFAAPEVSQTGGNNFDRPIVLRISTLSQAANVTITAPANGSFIPITIFIGPNSTKSVDLTSNIDLIESKPADAILNTGLKITSTAFVNIYYEVVSGLNTSCQCNPEIFVLKGKNGLGNSFIIPSQNILNNGPYYSPPAQNSFDIIATEDNTAITIFPSKDIVGHPAGSTFSLTLNKGQVYSAAAMGQASLGHLAGSRVTSNKPVAITLKDDLLGNGNCWDLGGDQIVPIVNLSNEYIAIRGFLNASSNDMVFVTAIDNNTYVYRDSNLVGTINANETIAIPFTNDAMRITSNNNIYAFQLSGFGCEVGLSSIPSNSCRRSSKVSFTRASSQDLFLLITTRAGNENAFFLNGTAVSSGSFSTVPGTGNQWVYARISIPLSQVPEMSAGVLINTKGIFHLGIIHGAASGGCRFAYFSDFATPELKVLPESLLTCASDVVLNAGSGFVNYSWSNGSTSQTTTVTQNGLYKITVTDKEGCILKDSGNVKFEKARSDSNIVTLCAGQSYKLPWGPTITTGGIYRDTLRYSSGCDSVIRIVNVK